MLCFPLHTHTQVQKNAITGSIPDLSFLANLLKFDVHYNQVGVTINHAKT